MMLSNGFHNLLHKKVDSKLNVKLFERAVVFFKSFEQNKKLVIFQLQLICVLAFFRTQFFADANQSHGLTEVINWLWAQPLITHLRSYLCIHEFHCNASQLF